MPRPIDNPPNPWLTTEIEWIGEPPPARLQVYEEEAKSILSGNDSPDLPFRWSLNPYRGCLHACAYCYARNSHGYWGFGAGTDFDRRIIAKTNAPDLLRQRLGSRSWQHEVVVLSGNTDCYQPLEASYGLTRRCLQTFLRYRSPVSIITKSSLIRRDLDLISELAGRGLVQVHLSIPSLSDDSGQLLEPHTPRPSSRFETMRLLHEAGVPVGISISPIIPGLNEHEVVALLERAHASGASWAWCTPLRLPGDVQEVFFARLAESYPGRVRRVQNALAELRAGDLGCNRPGARMQGHGLRWQLVAQLFARTCARLGLRHGEGASWPDRSAPPQQQELFGA